MAEKKHELGQYFTTDQTLREKVWEFILNNPSEILEPSIGRGDLVVFIQDKNPDVKFDMYEIDTEIIPLGGIDKPDIIYGDFMDQIVTKIYRTIIGNPPYVRTKSGNLYLDFTEKCYNSLYDGGELIFIVPSDFFKLTSAAELLKEMLENGTFTHIYHPNREDLFENASVDVLVFRYCKDPSLEKKTLYNGEIRYLHNQNGMVIFDDNPNTSGPTFSDMFHIYVGLVTGKEDIYKNAELGNISVINGLDKVEKYIYVEEFPSGDTIIDNYLLENKEALISRKIRKFNQDNWFEWGALRNISAMRDNRDRDCIYIYTQSRKQQIAFRGKVGYFGGNLLMLLPKVETINDTESLEKITTYINGGAFRRNFTNSGRFRIKHSNISKSTFPTL